MFYLGTYYLSTGTNDCAYKLAAAQREEGDWRMRTAINAIPTECFLMARNIIRIVN
jgi:uncharacterized protein (DUF2141 family)